MFRYSRSVHVYETDLMAIVHHSNYLRFCEEARVAWFVERGLFDFSREAIFGLTVYKTRVEHVKPARYADQVDIDVQLKIEGVRLIMQYLLTVQGQVVARAETIHCRLDQNFKVQRLETKLIQLVEKEQWIETWL